jgi:Fe-Mn family superoxide dismutase
VAFVLPDLPYSKDAFGDVLSAETFDFHHGKHHQAYVNQTNDQLSGAGLEGAKLSEVIVKAKQSGNNKLFNASAQLWNHSFYWQCLSPRKQEPSGKLKDMIASDFGSLSDLLAKLKQESAGHFASGWGWLVLDGGKLKVTSLHDADSPVAHDGMKPLLTIDVWEHAYYIDYRNARPDYLTAVLENAINWDFVAQNLDGNGVSRADQG